jgi:hypothetical protein
MLCHTKLSLAKVYDECNGNYAELALPKVLKEELGRMGKNFLGRNEQDMNMEFLPLLE